MRAYILFLIISLCSFNANAQLGDLFRKLGDTIDTVTKKIAEETNNQTKVEPNIKLNEEVKIALSNPGQAININDFPNLIGRWSYPDVCSIADKKSGAYISKNEKQELIIQNFVNSSQLIGESLINKLEQYSLEGKVYLKLTGTFTDKDNKNVNEERVWDITNLSNNKVITVERKYANQHTVKDGLDTNTGQKLSHIERCAAQNIIQTAKAVDLSRSTLPELSSYLNGRWSNIEGGCENRTGIYLQISNIKEASQNNKTPVTIQRYSKEGKLVEIVKYENIDWYKDGRRSLARMEDQHGDNFAFELLSQEKMRLITRTNADFYKKNKLIDNGIIVNTKEKINDYIKCKYKDQDPLYDSANAFGIKGFNLGATPPPMGSEKDCTPYKYFYKTKLETCVYQTTILEIPYTVIAKIFDDKISEVIFTDNIFLHESIANADSWQRNNVVGKLTIVKDFSVYSNDLIKSIVERNKNINPSITKEEIKSIQFINPMIVDYAKKEEKKSDQPMNRFINVLNNQCKSCKSTLYQFKWNQPTHIIHVATSVPESKEHPYPFYSVVINYKDKDIDNKIKNAEDLIKQLDNEERRSALDKQKKIEEEKNEKRKKDF